MKMKDLSYGVDTTVYTPSDAKGMFVTSMRETFKSLGVDFRVWKDQVVVKLPRDVVFGVIDSAMRSVSGGSKPWMGSYTAYVVEFSIPFSLGEPWLEGRETLLSNRDALRVYVELNYSEEEMLPPDSSDERETSEVLVAHTEVFGRPDLVDGFVAALLSGLRERQQAEKSALVSWIFSSNEGPRDKTFQITKTWEMKNEYYPWIETGINEYYRAFMESRSQILVLYGPPGTGKTSFIRDLLCETNLNAYISYDLKILTSDSTFVNYVTGSIFDAIVIEDADDLLTSDRGEQNKVIAKILNVSDGLIKLPKKKLIFSTNLGNVADIDQAIIRPGRCFDVMEFRELTRDEAEAAAAALGVTITSEKKRYSLAELFFMKDVQESTDPFTRKHGESLKKTFGFV